MTDESFFGRAATLFAAFAAVMVLMYVLGACAADADVDRRQAERCSASGYVWHGGLYAECRPTPTPPR